MSRLKYGSVISVIIGAILVTACGSTTTVDRMQNDRNEGQSVQSSEAEIIYKKKCMSCHGTNLQGRRGPSLQNIGSYSYFASRIL
ncbi:c-type cytochrome [Paenibacillus luteus]|uniref:c-type cytochrome n=1 Tax=Paenibacillus luteus TaxID=2545753 RepID=UPI003BAA7F0F